MAYKVKYVGGDPGSAWLPGVPASDHTVATKKERDQLVASGLYEQAGAAVPADEPAGDQAAEPETES